MSDPAVVRVTVVYALPEEQHCVALALAPGATLLQAVAASRLCERFAAPGGAPLEAGIFNRRCPPDTVLQDGDRVEIYRPLQIDPKVARHQRVARKRKAAGAALPRTG